MKSHAALLRAVNLAGRNRVSMADLRDLLARIGLPGAHSLLQSGNLVFESQGRTAAGLERLLETAMAGELGMRTDYFVRTSDQWRDLVARNPFPREAKDDPGHLLVLFLKEAPTPGDVKSLQAAVKGPEIVRAWERQAYIVYPDGVGRSKLTSALLEKKLGSRGTARNWNTVLKIGAMLAQGEQR